MSFEVPQWETWEDQIVSEIEDRLRSLLVEQFELDDLEDISTEQVTAAKVFAEQMPDYSWIRDRLVAMLSHFE